MRRKVRFVAVAVLVGVVLALSVGNVRAAEEPNWKAMTMAEIERYAAANTINLGDATSVEARIVVLRDAWANRMAQSSQSFDLAPTTQKLFTDPQPNTKAQRDDSLPSADLLKPILPDLSPDSIPGRVTRIVRVILGLVGIWVLIYGMVRLLLLAWEALTGGRSIRSLLQQLALYLATLGFVLAMMGGLMLEVIIDLYRFFSGL